MPPYPHTNFSKVKRERTGAGGGWEYPLFLTVTALVQVLLGDGAWALRWGKQAQPSAPASRNSPLGRPAT